MKLTRSKRFNSVVGISLSHGHFRAFHVARGKNGTETVRSASAELSLDLLHPAVELLGREIKNHLEAAGIRERRCVVALPATWLMSQHTALPDLSPEDTNSFLQIEAEKGFPCDPTQLQIARSLHQAGAVSYVTQLAVRREQVTHLTAALKSAGLKPLSFSLGLGALPGVVAAAGAPGQITLRVEPKGATVVVSVGGGIAALRSLEETIVSESGENLINHRALAREVRITYEQIPSELRAELRTLFLTGDVAMIDQMAEALAEWASDAGLSIERSRAATLPVADQVAQELATHFLEQGAPQLEFLPPRPSRWSQLLARYNSKRLATVGFAAAAAALVVLLAFGWQEYQRMKLRSEWDAMQAEVTALEGVQGRIRDYRPWYDTGFRNLTILKKVTECFPESGTVTAKSFEIHGLNNVSVSGIARDHTALLRTLEALGKVREVRDVKVEQIRGKAPSQQFTFTFRWNANPGT